MISIKQFSEIIRLCFIIVFYTVINICVLSDAFKCFLTYNSNAEMIVISDSFRQIFDSIEDMVCGKMICGAGGGGFLQIVLKRGETKEQI